MKREKIETVYTFDEWLKAYKKAKRKRRKRIMDQFIIPVFKWLGLFLFFVLAITLLLYVFWLFPEFYY